jgi:hypothetical protein
MGLHEQVEDPAQHVAADAEPVSRTEMATHEPAAVARSVTLPPSGVYFAASSSRSSP